MCVSLSGVELRCVCVCGICSSASTGIYLCGVCVIAAVPLRGRVSCVCVCVGISEEGGGGGGPGMKSTAL